MPALTAKNLASRFRSAASLPLRRYQISAAKDKRYSTGPPSSSGAAAAKTKPATSPSARNADDAALREYVSCIQSSSADVPEKAKLPLKNFEVPSSSTTSTLTISPLPVTISTISNTSNFSLHSIVSGRLISDCRDDDGESVKQLSSDASSILYDQVDFDFDGEYKDRQHVDENAVILPWFSKKEKSSISLPRKNVSQDRKHKWIFKSTQTTRFNRLFKMCAMRLGADAALELFGKLGRETGLKEYNAIIKFCIEKARNTTNEDVSSQQIYYAYETLKMVKGTGFELKEETYGQLLKYLIDFGMVEEFFFVHELIRDENPDSLPRLAYYEMLLWIRVNNEEKIQELCFSAAKDDIEEKLHVRESLLLALCESNRREELLLLLETLDIAKVASVPFLQSIFRVLGRFLLERLAEKFLLVLKGNDIGAENLSSFILEYTINIPDLAVENITENFQKLHTKLEVLPTYGQYKKLVGYFCDLSKLYEALNAVDHAFESGVALPLETFHSILDACDRSCEYYLVDQIRSRISDHNQIPNNETFKKMIFLHVKMKDFEGAYGLISDLQKINLTPTATMYNAILAGYFREKNIRRVQNVLKQMEDANVKPDAATYGYLIANCPSEKNLTKLYEGLIESGNFLTKQVFMALINAYASFGQFEKAKQVVLDTRIPVKNLNEIKSVLIGALACNGQLSCALKIYEEMRGAECDLDPKAIKSLVEHFESKGEYKQSLELLKELKDSPYWTGACFRVISHCIQHEDLRSAVDLLKQLKDKFIDAEVALEVVFDEVFSLFADQEPTSMHFGLSLLQSLKEELGIRPSRKSLDFLLSACVITKDSHASFLIWKEYEKAGLPYNVLSSVRMYQALLASGDGKSAAKLLNKIPKDDAHVRCIIKACQQAYAEA